jgi:hypothetical protein
MSFNLNTKINNLQQQVNGIIGGGTVTNPLTVDLNANNKNITNVADLTINTSGTLTTNGALVTNGNLTTNGQNNALSGIYMPYVGIRITPIVLDTDPAPSHPFMNDPSGFIRILYVPATNVFRGIANIDNSVMPQFSINSKIILTPYNQFGFANHPNLIYARITGTTAPYVIEITSLGQAVGNVGSIDIQYVIIQ